MRFTLLFCHGGHGNHEFEETSEFYNTPHCLPRYQAILDYRNKVHVGLLAWRTNGCLITPTYNSHEAIL